MVSGALVGLIVGGYLGLKTMSYGESRGESIEIFATVLVICSIVPLLFKKGLAFVMNLFSKMR